METFPSREIRLLTRGKSRFFRFTKTSPDDYTAPEGFLAPSLRRRNAVVSVRACVRVGERVRFRGREGLRRGREGEEGRVGMSYFSPTWLAVAPRGRLCPPEDFAFSVCLSRSGRGRLINTSRPSPSLLHRPPLCLRAGHGGRARLALWAHLLAVCTDAFGGCFRRNLFCFVL